jgi:hypothetical protein
MFKRSIYVPRRKKQWEKGPKMFVVVYFDFVVLSGGSGKQKSRHM